MEFNFILVEKPECFAAKTQNENLKKHKTARKECIGNAKPGTAPTVEVPAPITNNIFLQKNYFSLDIFLKHVILDTLLLKPINAY